MLMRAVRSVLDQTMTDWELIVVDDGTHVRANPPSDPRIRLIRNGKNRGPAVARNVGLDAAGGRFVTFLDDDDLFTTNRLRLGKQGLDDERITLCWARFADGPGGGGRLLEGWVFDQILDGSTPTLGCGVFPRHLAPPFDERWHAVEDIAWWMDVTRRAPVHTVPELGYLVGRHDGPRVRNHLAARVAENLEFLEVERDYFAGHRRALAFRWKRIGLIAEAIGDRSQARSAFFRSMALQPRPAAVWHLARSLF
jgi:glycosyltransferase involved in cell wall biosynthesis